MAGSVGSSPGWIRWVLPVAALVCVWQAAVTVRELALWREEAAAADRLRLALGPQDRALSWPTIRRHEAIAALARCMAVPWGERLAGAESKIVQRGGITLKSMELGADESSLRLVLNATNSIDAAAQARALALAASGSGVVATSDGNQVRLVWQGGGCRPGGAGPTS